MRFLSVALRSPERRERRAENGKEKPPSRHCQKPIAIACWFPSISFLHPIPSIDSPRGHSLRTHTKDLQSDSFLIPLQHWQTILLTCFLLASTRAYNDELSRQKWSPRNLFK